eukprot:991799-Amorphochlora_amoeboformis.AAC.1
MDRERDIDKNGDKDKDRDNDRLGCAIWVELSVDLGRVGVWILVEMSSWGVDLRRVACVDLGRVGVWNRIEWVLLAYGGHDIGSVMQAWLSGGKKRSSVGAPLNNGIEKNALRKRRKREPELFLDAAGALAKGDPDCTVSSLRFVCTRCVSEARASCV